MHRDSRKAGFFRLLHCSENVEGSTTYQNSLMLHKKGDPDKRVAFAVILNN